MNDNKLYVIAVSTDFVTMCFHNTIDMYESGIPITSYYVMAGDKVLDRVEL